MRRLSRTQHGALRSLSRTTENDIPGQRIFVTGWPTYTSLEKRGLAKITPVDGRLFRYRVALTPAGWMYLGMTPPGEPPRKCAGGILHPDPDAPCPRCGAAGEEPCEFEMEKL